jgi:hypothetical protein
MPDDKETEEVKAGTADNGATTKDTAVDTPEPEEERPPTTLQLLRQRPPTSFTAAVDAASDATATDTKGGTPDRRSR